MIIDVSALRPPRGDPAGAHEVRVAVVGEVDDAALARLRRALDATVAVRGPVLLDLAAARASGRRLLGLVRGFHQRREQLDLPCAVRGLHAGNLPPLEELTLPELALVRSGPPTRPARPPVQAWRPPAGPSGVAAPATGRSVPGRSGAGEA